MKKVDIFERAKKSRAEIAKRYSINLSNSEKQKGYTIIRAYLKSLSSAETVHEFADIIEEILDEVSKKLGPHVRNAVFERVKEKTFHEISDWLIESKQNNKYKKLKIAWENWDAPPVIAAWIESAILKDNPNAALLFEDARNSKVKELKTFLDKNKQSQ